MDEPLEPYAEGSAYETAPSIRKCSPKNKASQVSLQKQKAGVDLD